MPDAETKARRSSTSIPLVDEFDDDAGQDLALIGRALGDHQGDGDGRVIRHPFGAVRQAQVHLPRNDAPRRRLTPNTAYGCKPLPWYTFPCAEAAAMGIPYSVSK